MSDELPTSDRRHLALRDGTARRNLETIREEVVKGSYWTIPWLDLDTEAYRKYREGHTDRLP